MSSITLEEWHGDTVKVKIFDFEYLVLVIYDKINSQFPSALVSKMFN